jgi:hypothetical protein
MMRHKILCTVLVMSFSSSPLVANAQTIAPIQNDHRHAPASAQMGAAPMRDGPPAVETDGPAIVPMNSLVDIPRGMDSERRGSLCDNDVVTGQMPAGCRRWSQIAGDVWAYMADAGSKRLVHLNSSGTHPLLDRLFGDNAAASQSLLCRIAASERVRGDVGSTPTPISAGLLVKPAKLWW